MELKAWYNPKEVSFNVGIDSSPSEEILETGGYQWSKPVLYRLQIFSRKALCEPVRYGWRLLDDTGEVENSRNENSLLDTAEEAKADGLAYCEKHFHKEWEA